MTSREKRWVGILVLILAVFAAAVLASVSRSRIPGIAAAVPPAGPPAIGDCLTTAVDFTQIYLEDDNIQRTPYASRPLTPCRGAHFGEVADLVASAPDVPRPSPTTMAGSADDGGPITIPFDAVALRCIRAAEQYAGIPGASRSYGLAMRPNQWIPVALIAAAVVRPDQRQLAAGQNWAACIAMPSVDGPAPKPFTGTLKDAYHASYPAADVISLCDAQDESTQLGLSQVSCGTRHRVEYLGFAPTDGKTPLATLQASCLTLATARIGGADPTRGGALTLQAIATYTADDGSTELGVHADGSAVCRVTSTDPHRELTHSVASLGDRPVPLA